MKLKAIPIPVPKTQIPNAAGQKSWLGMATRAGTEFMLAIGTQGLVRTWGSSGEVPGEETRRYLFRVAKDKVEQLDVRPETDSTKDFIHLLLAARLASHAVVTEKFLDGDYIYGFDADGNILLTGKGRTLIDSLSLVDGKLRRKSLYPAPEGWSFVGGSLIGDNRFILGLKRLKNPAQIDIEGPENLAVVAQGNGTNLQLSEPFAFAELEIDRFDALTALFAATAMRESDDFLPDHRDETREGIASFLGEGLAQKDRRRLGEIAGTTPPIISVKRLGPTTFVVKCDPRLLKHHLHKKVKSSSAIAPFIESERREFSYYITYPDYTIRRAHYLVDTAAKTVQALPLPRDEGYAIDPVNGTCFPDPSTGTIWYISNRNYGNEIGFMQDGKWFSAPLYLDGRPVYGGIELLPAGDVVYLLSMYVPLLMQTETAELKKNIQSHPTESYGLRLSASL